MTYRNKTILYFNQYLDVLFINIWPKNSNFNIPGRAIERPPALFFIETLKPDLGNIRFLTFLNEEVPAIVGFSAINSTDELQC